MKNVTKKANENAKKVASKAKKAQAKKVVDKATEAIEQEQAMNEKVADIKKAKDQAKPLAHTFTAQEAKKAKIALAELSKGSETAQNKCREIVIMLMDGRVKYPEVMRTMMSLYPAWPVSLSTGNPIGLSTMRKDTATDEMKAFTNTGAYKYLNAFETTFRRYYMKGEDDLITDKVKKSKGKKEKKAPLTKKEKKAKIKSELENAITFLTDLKVDEAAIKAIREAMGYL